MKQITKKTALCLALCLAALVAAHPVRAAVGNWGLSFPQPGTQPMGNATREYLEKYNAYYVGDPEEKVIYLTFDAGFENGNTAPILDTLKQHNVPAAFFLVGHYIEQNADLVRRMRAEGHTVANHTYSHPDMSALNDDGAFRAELERLEAAFKDATGEDMPRIYRPPQGKYSEHNLAQACALGYKTVFWSLAYVDWYTDNQPTRQQAFDKLLPRIHPGAVVLLHSTSQTNAEILDELITRWKADGYVFGSIDEL